MKKKLLLWASLIAFTNCSNLMAMEDKDIEEYKKGITRATFVSGAVAAGAWLGENWSVDITTKLIKKSINSSPLLFDWTIGSSIRGESLIKAVPIASKKGAVVGAVIAAFLAPVVWDCGKSVGISCQRIYNTWTNDQTLETEKAKGKDYVATGVTGFGVISLLYALFWK